MKSSCTPVALHYSEVQAIPPPTQRVSVPARMYAPGIVCAWSVHACLHLANRMLQHIQDLYVYISLCICCPITLNVVPCYGYWALIWRHSCKVLQWPGSLVP